MIKNIKTSSGGIKSSSKPYNKQLKKIIEKNTFLKVGDNIQVDNPLLDPENSIYKVKKIIGNKAITDFRDFNIKIYNGKVYEYGKRYNPLYNNIYTVIAPA